MSRQSDINIQIQYYNIQYIFIFVVAVVVPVIYMGALILSHRLVSNILFKSITRTNRITMSCASSHRDSIFENPRIVVKKVLARAQSEGDGAVVRRSIGRYLYLTPKPNLIHHVQWRIQTLWSMKALKNFLLQILILCKPKIIFN